jgi:hypothetical protein
MFEQKQKYFLSNLFSFVHWHAETQEISQQSVPHFIEECDNFALQSGVRRARASVYRRERKPQTNIRWKFQSARAFDEFTGETSNVAQRLGHSGAVFQEKLIKNA